ncbi:hypothetical protein [Ramlibacter sp. AN1133]|uniref:hypothetical protein n=1 Tax=Ramlibacter sp. AN1133 TaxID=3133429 RepID=UPI0030C0AEBB
MKHTVVALLISGFAFGAIAADASGRFTILSMGTKSCGEVVGDFKDDGRAKLSNSIWVAGYLTAINEYVVQRSNVAAGTDAAAWDLWIYNYCSANPLDSLSQATSALAKELAKRNR